MAKTSGKQGATVERVMHEYKHGELKTSAGEKVKNRRQAVAIALSEAGESDRVSPTENRTRAGRTQARERQGDTGEDRAKRAGTRAELYEEAKRKGIAGRSTMSKAALAKAVDG
ncbi:DUF6496 domain-containing protein [Sphingomonas sp.]|uniref:DUF6496 domain-containing protein n=1 Tax=Sphingomonas sp. TaxID=28214 RepID=UPI003B005730